MRAGWLGDETEYDIITGRMPGSVEVRCRLSRRLGELGIILATNYGSATIESIEPASAAPTRRHPPSG